MRSFANIKPSQKFAIALSFTNVGKSCETRDFFTWQMCLLTLFGKLKFSQKFPKGEVQICPRMDFDNILYVEYLCYNNYKNEIVSFLEGC